MRKNKTRREKRSQDGENLIYQSMQRCRQCFWYSKLKRKINASPDIPRYLLIQRCERSIWAFLTENAAASTSKVLPQVIFHVEFPWKLTNAMAIRIDKLSSIHKVAVTICEKSLGQVRTSLLHGGRKGFDTVQERPHIDEIIVFPWYWKNYMDESIHPR